MPKTNRFGLIGPNAFGRSVCGSRIVSNALFSELAHYFFLIFGMKLGFHKHSKVTEPVFSGNLWFPRIWAKMVQNELKMDFFDIFSKLSH